MPTSTHAILTRVVILLALVAGLADHAAAQEARRRWELQRQIRLDKFDQILPRAMRAHGIDMWIVAVKENHREPLWDDLGRGYVSGIGYYVFTDRGAPRIERAALGPDGRSSAPSTCTPGTCSRSSTSRTHRGPSGAGRSSASLSKTMRS